MLPFDTLLERIRERTVRNSQTGCHIWTGPLMYNGYGQLNWSRQIGPVLVHRLAYAIEHRVELDELQGKVVMHLCNTPACVRPSHLHLGTQRENLAAMQVQGRAPRGERSGNAKLTEANVREIRKLWDEGTPASRIAPRFGVSDKSIYLIAHRVNWKHVD